MGSGVRRRADLSEGSAETSSFVAFELGRHALRSLGVAENGFAYYWKLSIRMELLIYMLRLLVGPLGVHEIGFRNDDCIGC